MVSVFEVVIMARGIHTRGIHTLHLATWTLRDIRTSWYLVLASRPLLWLLWRSHLAVALAPSSLAAGQEGLRRDVYMDGGFIFICSLLRNSFLCDYILTHQELVEILFLL